MVKKMKNIKDVFNLIRGGNSLYNACLKAKISTKEFYQILANDKSLYDEYLLALSDYADQCTDDIKNIITNLKDGDIDNSTAKLLIETQKWLAQKLCPQSILEKKIQADENKEEDKEIVVKFIS